MSIALSEVQYLRIAEIVVAIMLIATTILLGLTIHRLYRRRFAKSHPAREAAVDLIKRLGVTFLTSIAAIITFMISLHGDPTVRGEAIAMITIGLFPIVGAFFVGFKKDVLSVWFSSCLGPRALQGDHEHNREAEKGAVGY